MRIVQAIGNDENSALTVSMLTATVEGVGPVALSLPRLIGRTGVVRTLAPNLAADEHAALKRSAEVVREAAAGRR